jgi:hypothetical protein
MGEAKWRKDNPDKARQAVRDDLRRMVRAASELGIPQMAVGPNKDDWPEDDGDGTMCNFVLGSRGALNEKEARAAADMWRTATARYPKAFFQILFLGYDDDPRELFEFEDLRRYVCRWAELTGMNDAFTANRWIGMGNDRLPVPVEPGIFTAGMGLLIACGVFGEAERQRILAGAPKPVAPS